MGGADSIAPWRPILACAILLSIAACATTPPLARPGNPLRVTTTEGDTVYGALIAVRPETLVLAGVDQDSMQVARRTIERVEIDRTRRHWWSGTVVACALAVSGIALTAVEVSENGWSWRMAHGSLLAASSGWDCVDTRPRWMLARIEGEPQ